MNFVTNNIVKNILITGNPGVGKTTLIKGLIGKLGISAGGFYTSEIRDENGKRWGFKIISLDGKEEILASVEIISRHRVSKYGVDPEAVDRIGVKAICDAITSKDLIIIDEIGRMEMTSKTFREVITEALNSKKLVLGTIAMKEKNISKKITERQDSKIIKLTRNNFHEVERHLERLLSKALEIKS